MKKSLKTKLMVVFAGLIILLSSAIGIISYLNSKKMLEEAIRSDMKNIANSVVNMCRAQQELLQDYVNSDYKAAELFFKKYSLKTSATQKIKWKAVNQLNQAADEVNLPALSLNDNPVLFNNEPSVYQPVVDELTKLTGATATIFQRMNDKGDMLRISTSVINAAGKRAVGTYIPAINLDGKPNPIITSVINGQTYRGRAFVVDQWYITVYSPIKDSSGNVIGILYVGRKEQSVTSLKEAVRRIKIGTTGHVFVFDSKGVYQSSREGLRDGESMWESKDMDGKFWVQEIIAKAKIARLHVKIRCPIWYPSF